MEPICVDICDGPSLSIFGGGVWKCANSISASLMGLTVQAAGWGKLVSHCLFELLAIRA